MYFTIPVKQHFVYIVLLSYQLSSVYNIEILLDRPIREVNLMKELFS